MDDLQDASERLICQTYVYSSYVLHLAVDCLSRGAAVAPNDFEDASFCLHLSLTEPTVAVTHDRRMKRCLGGVLSDLSAVDDERFRNKLSVVDSTEAR